MCVIATILITLSMIFIILMAWCICANGSRDERDDESQLNYINDWRRKHGLQ